MEKARRRVNFCVFVVVFMAVVMGILYYYGQSKDHIEESEGTLISNVGIVRDFV